MKLIDGALIKYPGMNRNTIIRFGCPDNWGLIAKAKCKAPNCKECWEQELRDKEAAKHG
ncbi:MAG: hypothetical protein PHD54_16430 [Desulfuromonadaceae bacterium]|nr:hypothetical protein [Desulfuromonadaceae bacterium]